MTRFVDLQLSAFLDALASKEPTPGGGTAAAIAGAMGASLLMMVSGLPKTRNGTDEDKVALSEACAALSSVRDRLTALADADSDAYNKVLAAFRLPKANDEEKGIRKNAMQEAFKAATLAPLDTLRAASDGMRLAAVVARHANRNATSDVGVGVGLLQAAADGAVANVDINLASIQDEAFKASTTDDAGQIRERLAADAKAARQELGA